MKFYIRTLGCKMNSLDSARISAALQTAGHELAANEEEAETIFVNTCTVTAEADRKSHKEVKRAANQAEQVAIMGCGPRVEISPWQQQASDSLIFTEEAAIYERFGVDPETLPFPLTSRTRLPIAIQTGCDNACSFCITRVARGHHQNLPSHQIVEQIKQARDEGINEIVLTGINLAAWGCDDSNRAEQGRLHQLIETILLQTDMPRIRLSSLGPQYLHEEFFDVFADQRLCDYLHISLQSGSDSVLERMERGHGTDEMRMIAERARKIRPDVSLAADIIAGFPGESDAEQAETLELIRELEFAKLHVFPYSEREGTPAAAMVEPVSMAVRKQRASAIRALGSALRKQFIQQQMGKTHQVLVEMNSTGWTGNYIRVKTNEHPRNSIMPITLDGDVLAE